MKKVLVIEDELLLRKGVSEILTFEGYDVYEAENGETGILSIPECNPDLILCDIMMPVMDGYEVLTRLQHEDNTSRIPFIFMTALADRSDQRTGMELGSDDYLTKPFTRDELLNAMTARFRKDDEIQRHEEDSLNELRTNIIRHMPHEFITPLNTILCYGEHLKDYASTLNEAELIEIGTILLRSGTRLHRLIENYLLYAQLELGVDEILKRHKIEEPHRICRLNAEKIATNYERSKDVQFHLAEGTAFIGREDFAKIVDEITDNAFKFSQAGSPVIITCGTDGSKFKFTVQDFGRGMTKSESNRIGAFMQFERKFYEQQGSGLGLILSKRIIEKYSGTLTIESVPGKGTTLHILLPS